MATVKVKQLLHDTALSAAATEKITTSKIDLENLGTTILNLNDKGGIEGIDDGDDNDDEKNQENEEISYKSYKVVRNATDFFVYYFS